MSLTAYKVVHSSSHSDLTDQLTDLIADGWQPYGQPMISDSGALYQAVTQGSQVLVGATGATGASGTAGATGATGASAAVQTFYGTTSSAANTYAVTISGATPLAVGSVFFIKFTHAPTGAATLNVNGVGAHPIVLATGAAISGAQGVDGQVAMMVWDGTSFVYPVQPNNS